MLVAYERVKSPGESVMHEAQARIGRWLLRRVTLLVPALSLAIASRECGGDLPELDYLIDGDPDLVLTVPVARESAVDVGAASTALQGEDFEIAHVVWCATGHDDDGDPSSRKHQRARPVVTALQGLSSAATRRPGGAGERRSADT